MVIITFLWLSGVSITVCKKQSKNYTELRHSSRRLLATQRSLGSHPKQRKGWFWVVRDGCLQSKVTTTASLAGHCKLPHTGLCRRGLWVRLREFTNSTPRCTGPYYPSQIYLVSFTKLINQGLCSSACPHKGFVNSKEERCPAHIVHGIPGKCLRETLGYLPQPSWPAGPGNYHRQPFQKTHLTPDYPPT